MLFVSEYLSGIVALLIVTSVLCFGKNKMLCHFLFPLNSGNGVRWLCVQSNFMSYFLKLFVILPILVSNLESNRLIILEDAFGLRDSLVFGK